MMRGQVIQSLNRLPSANSAASEMKRTSQNETYHATFDLSVLCRRVSRHPYHLRSRFRSPSRRRNHETKQAMVTSAGRAGVLAGGSVPCRAGNASARSGRDVQRGRHP